MKTLRSLILPTLAALVVSGAVALAQIVPGLFITNLTGSEQINVVNAGPQIATVLTSTLRNSTGYQLSAQTSGTLTPAPTVLVNNVIFTAAVTTLTVNLPPTPGDGALFALNNGTSSNFSGTITVATTDGSTIANGSTAVNLGADGSQEWQYTVASKIWYRLR